MIKVTQAHPSYETNYGPGWIGFVSRRDNFISEGINWFCRWDEISHVPVSHAINIIGADMTVEALAQGVTHGSLHPYLNAPDVALLVRKPRLLSPDLAERIVNEAELYLGEPYNYELIAALAAAETYSGHALNILTGGWWAKHLVMLADKDDEWDCSKLAVTTLHQPDLVPLGGVLTWLPAMVQPIDLFEDTNIFEDGAIELVPEDHALNDS